jgi:hypothetical protein
MRRAFVVPAALAAALASAEAGAQAAAPATVPIAQGSPLAGFSVVLVLGSESGDLTPVDRLPAPAARALADLKDFLPYKSFQLLDTQWTIGSRGFTSRLRGPQGLAYTLTMKGGPVSATRIMISSFELRDTRTETVDPEMRARTADVARDRLAERRARREQLMSQLYAARARYRAYAPEIRLLEEQMKTAAVAEAEAAADAAGGAAKQVDPVASGAVIDTSFTMDAGETVVVGTSRLQGDKALIVLLTAVKKTHP